MLTPIPRARALAAAVLAAAMFILAALLGPHVIEHFLGTGGDQDHCAVCAAIQGAGAGIATATQALVPAFFAIGPPTLQHPLAIPSSPISAAPSRAPPAVA